MKIILQDNFNWTFDRKNLIQNILLSYNKYLQRLKLTLYDRFYIFIKI